MTGGSPDPRPGQEPSTGDTGSSEAERRRRRAAVFGDVLPDATSDELGDEEHRPGGPGEAAGDEWLRRQVPPHHG